MVVGVVVDQSDHLTIAEEDKILAHPTGPSLVPEDPERWLDNRIDPRGDDRVPDDRISTGGETGGEGGGEG